MRRLHPASSASVLALLALLAPAAGQAQEGGVADPEVPAEWGEATFMHDALHGELTASGVPLDQDALVAAHREHAFGTMLRVTNLENGRSVLVRVVDRGPFAPGVDLPAVVDLSRAAAEQLDMVQQGRVVVSVEVVAPPPPAPASARRHAIQELLVGLHAFHPLE